MQEIEREYVVSEQEKEEFMKKGFICLRGVATQQ
jgi:hypothetical protein